MHYSDNIDDLKAQIKAMKNQLDQMALKPVIDHMVKNNFDPALDKIKIKDLGNNKFCFSFEKE